MVPSLRRAPRPSNGDGDLQLDDLQPSRSGPDSGWRVGTKATLWARKLFTRLLPVKTIPFYFRHPAFLPSISLSLLYLTVLSFSGQMITFLLNSGYNSFYVGLARAISTMFELSATWIAPRLMKKIGPVRGCLWSLYWQMAFLAGGISWFFADGEGQGSKKVLAASGLVGGVILSRVGLWGFDLCAQSIIQDVRILEFATLSVWLD